MIPVLTLLAWLIWLIGYWNGGLKVVTDIRAARDPRDRHLLIALSSLTALLVVGMVVTYLRGAATANNFLAGNGLLFVGLGVGGTFYSRWTLGRFWTAQTTLQRDHQVVSSGLYGIVRHPIYVAAILLYMGTALVFLTPMILILIWVIIGGYVLKTDGEDRYLRACLPGYDRYTQRVPYRLIPLVW